MNPLWNVYKSKVMNTFNPDGSDNPANPQEQEIPEEVVTEVPQEKAPVQEDETSTTVSQLAKKVQGAGAMGWKSVSALFNKEEEQQSVQNQRQPAADHPLAVRPQEEDNKNSGFWDSFTTKWQQATGAEAGVAGEAEQSGQGYVSEGGANEDPSSFKWDFVTNKLAELKSITKTT
ncbi:hypothetical protein P4O66_004904 [Electrophorus voltai]|uniref:Testis development related protein n=1 Tax=Electrophorus voltai TaxID=2609070 RepID=A0AAD9E405_9TELE|nr:hypothetical protein P4O66_004904 [Electrophorus voltai]